LDPGILIAVRLELHAGPPCAILRFQQLPGIRVSQLPYATQNSVPSASPSCSPAISAPDSRGRSSAVRFI